MFDYVQATFTLTEPVVVTAGQGRVGNGAVSLPYLPARAQRGMVSAALAEMPMLHRAVIEEAGVCFADAYPVLEEDRWLTIPTPLSVRVQAPVRAHPYQSTMVDLTALSPPSGDAITLQRPPPLLALDGVGQPVRWVALSFKELTRIQRERSRQRPTQHTGGPFHSLALSPGQMFRAYWRVRADKVDSSDLLRLDGPKGIGWSKAKAFGGTPIVELDNASGPSPLRPTLVHAEEFLVVLTSPALLSDPLTGEDDPEALAAVVAGRFAGKAVTLAQRVDRFAVGGYHGRWPGYLPLRWAAGPGSVVRLRVSEPAGLSADVLQALQDQPMGDNWADGCGCFAVLHDPDKRPNPDVVAPKAARTAGPGGSTAVDMTIVADLQHRLYRSAAQRAVHLAAVESAATVQGSVGGTGVLSWLRQLLHNSNDPFVALLAAVGSSEGDGNLSSTYRKHLQSLRATRSDIQKNEEHDVLRLLQGSLSNPLGFFRVYEKPGGDSAGAVDPPGAGWVTTIDAALAPCHLTSVVNADNPAPGHWLEEAAGSLVVQYWEEWLYHALGRLRRQETGK